MTTSGKLVLHDGSVFEGTSFGYPVSSAGEVVFTTGMVGYPESLTDPSYCGQILICTYPLIGNYGVPPRSREDNISSYFESDHIQVRGLIVAEYSPQYSHWNSAQSLGQWLHDEHIPALCGIDTRALTKKLREYGVMLGKIIIGTDPEFDNPNERNLVDEVSIKEKIVYTGNVANGHNLPTVLLVDCGVKNNIIRSFLKREVSIIRVPWDYDFSKDEYDGLFISNGPGDPKQCIATIEHIRGALHGSNHGGKPIFGICLGSQIIALAAGADTYKLKYGHRGQNQPCQQKGTARCYITTQNHGYAVDAATLPADWEESFVNANDGTNEGIHHKTKPFFAVQFHPESSPGPTDMEWLFDEFIRMVKEHKHKSAGANSTIAGH